MFIAGIGNPKRKPTEKDAATHLNSKNYGASISQLIDCNDDPFDQDVEHVLMDNILKYGDDPMVNFEIKLQQRTESLSFFLSLNQCSRTP